MKIDDTTRRNLRAALASSETVPPQQLDEVVDIAIHAAESAIAVLIRVALDTHPDARVGICACGPALSLLVAMAQTGIEGIKEYGQARGIPVHETTVGACA